MKIETNIKNLLKTLHEKRLELADLEDEIRHKVPQLTVLENEINQLESQIKESVLKVGHTITGDNLIAVYTPSKITWDGKALQGYSIANPEVLNFRKESKPFVTIKEIKE